MRRCYAAFFLVRSWVLICGEALHVDVEPIEKTFQLHLLEDDSDASHDTGAVSHNVVTPTQHHVATRRCHIPRKGVELQVVLAGEVLDLVTDDLTLHRQASGGVDDHCEGNCPSGLDLFEALRDGFGAG